MNFKRFTVNVALVLFSVLLTFAALEGALRLYYYNEVDPVGWFRPDPELVFGNKPGFEMAHKTDEFDVRIKINSEGLRDYEHVKDAHGREVILGIGDSTTWGWGAEFEDTYLRQLEKMFDHGNEGRYEVVKAGVCAYDTVDESKYLVGLVRRYKPKVVILNFVYNDAADVAWGGIGRYYVCEEGWLKDNTFLTRMSTHTYLGDILFRRWRELSTRLKKYGKPLFAHGDGWSWDFTDIYNLNEPAYIKVAWDKIFKAVKDMDDEARRNGARLVVVAIPEKDTYLQPGEKGYDFSLPGKRLGGYCTRNSILFYDPMEKLRASGGVGLYYKRDPHLNPSGYKALAEGVRDYLLANGIVQQ